VLKRNTGRDEDFVTKTEALVEALPEPPVTDPESQRIDPESQKTDLEPPDEVEQCLGDDLGDVNVSLLKDTSKQGSDVKDRSEEVVDADTRTDVKEGVIEETRTSVSVEDVGVDPKVNRSESFYSAVSSLDGGEKNLLVDLEEDSQQELQVTQETQPVVGTGEKTLSGDMVSGESLNSVETRQEDKTSKSKELSKDLDTILQGTVSEETQSERSENSVSRKVVSEVTDRGTSEKLSDKLYPVLDKFIEQTAVSSERLEVISCSVGPTAGAVSAPGGERFTEGWREQRSAECRPSKDRVQPLTREQMQSLYYNAQLASNPAFIDRFIQVGYR
jgi:hypothetical protein